VWQTGGPGYRIVAGHHLTQAADGTGVRLDIELTGPLAGALWALTGRTTRRYVEEEAAALKRRCEAGV
jgi:hypothetical protein